MPGPLQLASKVRLLTLLPDCRSVKRFHATVSFNACGEVIGEVRLVSADVLAQPRRGSARYWRRIMSAGSGLDCQRSLSLDRIGGELE